MDPVIANPGRGLMTQGTLFSCAVAADYGWCATYGIVITARCDIAHDKVQVHNYLPVVALDDWLHRDGRILLARRLMSEAIGVMSGVLKESGFSPLILDTQSPRNILDTLYPTSTGGKFRERFEKGCTRFELGTRCLDSLPSEKLSVSLGKEAPKLRDALLGELVRNTLSGFYFLKSAEPGGSDAGFVILIREVQTIPRELASAVAQGLDAELYGTLCEPHPSFRDKLSIRKDDFACPVGQMSSPHLEHLLQTFAFLFGRIGLPDPERAYIENLWNRQPTVVSVV